MHRLFRFLFENDKENLLQLYNALNGTDYHDVEAYIPADATVRGILQWNK
ncbi:MAG: hypothetical protein NC433_16790 [Clostridiales bacterium]|nr:hypothetical protein [Clostridiales bacterium]